MAVEARNINLFPPQTFIPNGDFMCNNTTQMNEAAAVVVASSSQFLPATINKADSGLTTYNNNNMNIIPPAAVVSSATRKRPRDSSSFINSFNCFDSFNNNNNTVLPRKNNNSVLDDDNNFFSQIQQQHQQEIDRFIAQHTEKVRLEVEERRKRQTRVLITAIQEGVMKKLKEKDEEIQRMGKINWVLQEKVKSLYLENQLWRDLAQTNEATANSLRTNLEQVLAHVGDQERVAGGGGVAPGADLADDAESSCGSSDEGWRKVVVPPPAAATVVVDGGDGERRCRKCGEKEASVLLLPCRHLCLCTTCGSTLVGTCLVCDSVTNASVHVNMS